MLRLSIALAIVFVSLVFADGKPSNIEVGIGTGLSYISTEKNFAPSVHVHLSKDISEHFSLGIGYEALLDEDEHHIVGVRLGYYTPFGVVLSYMPGVYVNKDGRVSHHFEAMKLLPISSVHFGIFTAVSVEKDPHYTLGVHLGF